MMHRDGFDQPLSASGRGFSDAKTIGACVFAAFGVGLAGWSFFAGGGGEAEPVREQAGEVISTLDAEGNAAEAIYESTRGDEAARVVTDLAGEAEKAARSVAGFGTQGDGSAEALGESIELALASLVSGDHDAFLEAMAALGGVVPGELDGDHPLFSRLEQKLKGAEVDLTRLEVTAHENRRGGPRVRQRATEDEEAEDNRNYSERVMEMRPGGLFEDAMANVDERALDVKFPYLPKGADKEEWFGLVLVWNPDVRKWQPGAFQMIKREVTVTP